MDVLEYRQTGHARAVPQGSYQRRDGLWIALSGSTQPMAQHVLRTIGGDSLVTDPRSATNADRVRHE